MTFIFKKKPHTHAIARSFMKISVIMQVYLGQYPGARNNPKHKFVRAVHSFLAQTHLEKELIIVADRCPLTKKIYDLLFQQEDEIKCVYLSSSTEEDSLKRRMYNSQKIFSEARNKTFDVKYYRGIPKQKGIEIASGEIITYLDSDDIMLPNHLSVLNYTWSLIEPEIKWIGNTRRILNRKVINHPLYIEKSDMSDSRIIDLSAYGIQEPYFINSCGNSKSDWPCASYAISHRKNIEVKWEDTEAAFDENGKKVSGNSEDVRFVFLLCKHHGAGWWCESPSYVVCHYRGIYDN